VSSSVNVDDDGVNNLDELKTRWVEIYWAFCRTFTIL